MKKWLVVVVFFVGVFPMLSLAGSRGVNLAFVDATVGERSPEGLRLAELLVKDMRSLYAGEAHVEVFPWNEPYLRLAVLRASAFQARWDRLLNGASAKEIASQLLQNAAQDGLIVYAYDRKHGHARLKLYDGDGAECLLLRLPLEGAESAMKHSVLKHTRHGALVAIGSAVRWNP